MNGEAPINLAELAKRLGVSRGAAAVFLRRANIPRHRVHGYKRKVFVYWSDVVAARPPEPETLAECREYGRQLVDEALARGKPWRAH